MRFLLYHHKNLPLAQYVLECSPTLMAANKAGLVKILSLPQQHSHADFATLPMELRKLLFYARPDLVICADDGIQPIFPAFAFELTDHVPAQDHWMQRFNHLVGCAQQGVPGAYVLPFGMPNHPTFKSALDHVFFYAYDRVTEIHETPIFIAEWEVIDGKTTRCDPKFPSLPDRNTPDLKLTFEFLERVIDCAIHGRPVSELYRERLVVDLRNRIRHRGYTRIPAIGDFKRLAYNMPLGRALDNTELAAWLKGKGLSIPKNFPERLLKRGQHVIFVPQSDRRGNADDQLRVKLKERIELKGGDPYLGQPLAFDYMFCRLGPTTYERDKSLIIDLSVLRFEDMAQYHRKVWEESPLQHTDPKKIKDVPTYTMHLKEGSAQVLKNVLRIYAYAADVIVYRDALIYF